MAKFPDFTCDHDDCDTHSTERYVISTTNGSSELALCHAHATPLIALYERGHIRKRPGRRPGVKHGLASIVLEEPTDSSGTRPRSGLS